MTKRLYFGDNLDVLRKEIKDESIDLIYLDPPFNSAANHNVLFRAPDGRSSESQLEAFDVLGTPKDIGAAHDLAARDKHQFQWWAVSLVDAVPQGGKKKGADQGIDGIRWVRTGPREADLDRVIVSVKGGENVSVRDVRDLAGTVQREGALGGLLVTLAPPTRPMLTEAASHGFASTGLGQFRKIMVKTVQELMAGVHDDAERLPPLGRQEGFRRAARERRAAPEQSGLDL